jgi:CBS domain-containing protein
VTDFPPPTKIEGPLYVTDEDTLHDVVSKMALNHIHRVYVVSNDMVPQRVISQTDILKEILKRYRQH